MGQQFSKTYEPSYNPRIFSLWSVFQKGARSDTASSQAQQSPPEVARSEDFHQHGRSDSVKDVIPTRNDRPVDESIGTTVNTKDLASNQDSDSDADCDCGPGQDIAKILATLDQQQIPQLAASLFKRLHPESSDDDAQPSIGELNHGSYNVVLPLTFNNGTRWALKIPIGGHSESWNEDNATELSSEVCTMKLIKRETTVPIPEIFDFCLTTDNIIKVPYILMSWIEGVRLCDLWFSHRTDGVDPEVNRERCARAIQGVASAIFELGKISSNTSGRIIGFDTENQPILGPERSVDEAATMRKWYIEEDKDEGCVYMEHPITSDPKPHYLLGMDRNPGQDNWDKGNGGLVRQLVHWIDEPSEMDTFVMTHPDFNYQNIIVSEEGELRGIIDWEGARFSPRSVGNEALPAWLTRDWAVGLYGWTEEMEAGEEPDDCWEDSPQTLSSYRNVYRDAMKKLVAENRPNDPVDLCRASLITTNISFAARVPLCRQQTLRKIYLAIWAAAYPKWAASQEEYRQWSVVVSDEVDCDDDCDDHGQEDGIDGPPSFLDVLDMFAEDRVPEDLLTILRRGFDALLAKESL
ncbi:hypothetical protein F66182_7111 [Fusarium sp. NRRL 66182]|nr:hypothetical protein F66182_7111 [Fusarium sp. NRRL 66182]